MLSGLFSRRGTSVPCPPVSAMLQRMFADSASANPAGRGAYARCAFRGACEKKGAVVQETGAKGMQNEATWAERERQGVVARWQRVDV